MNLVYVGEKGREFNINALLESMSELTNSADIADWLFFSLGKDTSFMVFQVSRTYFFAWKTLRPR